MYKLFILHHKHTYAAPEHPPVSFKPSSEYLTRGCAGDVRRLFEVLRCAIDLALVPFTIRNYVDENPFNPPNAIVTLHSSLIQNLIPSCDNRIDVDDDFLEPELGLICGICAG